MKKTPDHITFLLELYLSNKASLDEVEELFQFLNDPANDADEIYRYVQAAELRLPVDSDIELPEDRKPGRVHFLRRWAWAAAAVVILAVGAYLLTNKDSQKQRDDKTVQTEFTPGGNRAVLTLADGRAIALDSVANGDLALQGNAQVVKMANGQIVYEVKGPSEKEILWNTMSTPVGGQYQVTLPDGTRVWLNAASSITFPTAFMGKNRQVKITGEAYLEVVKNKEKPFLIDVDGRSAIEVLGTSFNINSYRDEESIKTTLIEGRLKVTRGPADMQSIIIIPGQQASVAESAAGIAVRSDIDLIQVIAWKNGLFNFNGLTVRQVLHQLARWYDIKVQIQGKEPDFRFIGEMYRNVNLSDVLEMLKKFGVKFKMEGKTLIVIE